MAHTLSAKKRIRQNVKRRARNRWRKGQIKDVVKAFEDTLKSGDAKKMDEALRACYKKLDQVAAKGTIHKNAAARGKARLAKARNKATA
ncbi:MAG: 30S ribosomal protein S20 [Phycisphaerae bacterium]|nr:30S ribosomal protein S20 [Phycisphaerae bacterium]